MKSKIKASELERIFKEISCRMGYVITSPTFNRLDYEFFERGTFTACIISIDDNIVGIGMTRRHKRDVYCKRVAEDVSFSKAVRDYIQSLTCKFKECECDMCTIKRGFSVTIQ